MAGDALMWFEKRLRDPACLGMLILGPSTMSAVYHELNVKYQVAEDKLVPFKDLKCGDVQVLTVLGRRMAFGIPPHYGATIKGPDAAKRAYFTMSTFATATFLMTAGTSREERAGKIAPLPGRSQLISIR
ncbi:hypothetical protein P389DRAFT_170646 [Cystobasidium minutum MCA 4210]|uniref:uncharacterized protein n=1 Tax=Cystobasidium minutum MCA 4210 TaxID=1397322 RepID=UPI0034CF07C0|eukprot:jgi/Rhomi1/170646/fgenesh1_kg.4_\